MTHTSFNLTEGELKAALILVQSCLSAMCGKRPIDLDNDPFTWVSISDLRDAGYSQQQAAGFFSALHAKGMIHGDWSSKRTETYLSDAAYRWLDTVWDANQTLLKAA